MGAGRAGRALGAALTRAGATVVAVHGRQDGALPARLGGADVVLVTVKDGDLPAALAELRAAPLAAGAIVLHASGASDPAIELDALRAAGHPAGTFHPLVPLADPALAADALAVGWIGLDGDALAIAAGRRLAEALGARVLVIPPGTKPRYHAAAVMASNFPVVLAAVATAQLESIGIAPDAARGAVSGLLAAASRALETMAPKDALVGPVARGDHGTVARHVAALADDPAALALYVACSWAAIELAAAAGTDPEQLAAIRHRLSDALEVAPPDGPASPTSPSRPTSPDGR
jgi:predicted short-subunit dehydrogenase-like oxidoreductase (DUF2520 family)